MVKKAKLGYEYALIEDPTKVNSLLLFRALTSNFFSNFKEISKPIEKSRKFPMQNAPQEQPLTSIPVVFFLPNVPNEYFFYQRRGFTSTSNFTQAKTVCCIMQVELR